MPTSPARRCPLPALVLLAAACTPAPDAAPARVERVVAAMGTELRIAVVADGRPTALAAGEAAALCVAATERRLSNWTTDSEVERLARGEVVTPSPELAADLASCEPFVARTAGAFDPRGLDGDARSVDTGGWGKGRALDLAARAALDAGARGVRVDLGGQVHTAGTGVARRLVLADPRERGRGVLAVDLPLAGAATSATTVRGDHLVDPSSGERVAFSGSVTVVSDSALAADALSTGLFVLGPDAALAHARAHADCEVLVLAPEGERLVARFSRGLSGRVAALAPDVVLAPVAAGTADP